MHLIRWLSIAAGIAAGFILNIQTGQVWQPGIEKAAGAVLLGTLLFCPPRFKIALLFAAAFLYGYASHSTDFQRFHSGVFQNQHEMILKGEVSAIPEKYYSGWRWKLKLSEFRCADWEWQKIRGTVDVRISRLDIPPLAGDQIVLKGRVSLPQTGEPGMVWQRQRLFFQGYSALIRIRDEGALVYTGWNYLYFPLRLIQLFRESLFQQLEKIYPQPEADILQALLLGTNLKDSETRNVFVRTGTSHILSVSGFHTAVAAGILFFIAILCRLSPAAGVSWSALLILVYMVLTGWGIAVQRAGFMAVCVWIGWAWGRPQSLGYWLAAALALLLWVDPKYLGSISFQLSFLSMAGILAAAPQFKKYLNVHFGLDISLAAFFASYPAVLFHFQTFCLTGIIANLAAVPVFALILPLGYLSLLPGAGLIAKPLTQFLLSVILYIMSWLSRFEFSAFSLPQPPLWQIDLYYFSGTWVLWHLNRPNRCSLPS